jgi:hypothetical protein
MKTKAKAVDADHDFREWFEGHYGKEPNAKFTLAELNADLDKARDDASRAQRNLEFAIRVVQTREDYLNRWLSARLAWRARGCGSLNGK